MKQIFRKYLTDDQAVQYLTAIAFVIATALIGISNQKSTSAIRELTNSSQWVNHTQEVTANLRLLSELLLTTQSNSRGYFITGQDFYLQKRETAMRELNETVHHLRELTSDNPTQQKNFDKLDQELAARLVRWKDINTLYETKGFPAIRKRMQGPEGKQHSAEIAQLVQTMLDEEQRLLVFRKNRNELETKSTMRVVTASDWGSMFIVITSALLIALHIRKRRKSENSLKALQDNLKQEIEEKTHDLRMLTESIPQIVWQTSEDGRTNYLSPKWYEYTGGTPGELKLEEAIHSEDILGLNEALALSYQNLQSFEHEFRIRGKDGNYRWFLGRAIPEVGSDGKVKRLFGTSTDIHNVKVMRESLLEERQRTDTILNHAPILLWAVDQSGVFTYYDGRCAKTLGIDPKDRIGKNILELYKGRPEIEENVQRALMGETRADSAQIKGIWLENIFSPLHSESGKVIGVVGLSVDISERRKSALEIEKAALEKQQLLVREKSALEASRLKSEFLANMSHEIRTPINGVMGMTGLLLDTSLSAEQRDYAETVRRSAETLLTVINDILDFSKVEAGKMELENIEFDLGELVSDVHKTLGFSSQQKNLPFLLESSPEWSTNFVGDSGRIRQILTNLISNAIKFTKNGHVSLRVHSGANANSSSRIRFEIEDTGTGIPKAAMDRMFQAFSQADSTVTRRYGGTGLGLSICKKLVQLMNGQIGVESEEGKGSTFWFEIPLAKGNPVSRLSIEERAVSGVIQAENSRPFRILLAEDNLVNQKLATKLIEKMGHRADSVANGNEAIAALQSIPYDIVLMDCQMPEMDGYQATRIIRQSSAATFCNIPIIALTANAISGDKEKCIEAGMNDYLSKPIQFAEFRKVLERWTKQMGA